MAETGARLVVLRAFAPGEDRARCGRRDHRNAASVTLTPTISTQCAGRGAKSQFRLTANTRDPAAELVRTLYQRASPQAVRTEAAAVSASCHATVTSPTKRCSTR